MTTWLAPGPGYRTSFKRGMKGTDVAGLQINLDGVTVDGDFGPETEAAIMDYQHDGGLVEDGIAGPATQKRIIRVACGPVQREQKLPGGILLSIANNESGLAVSAYTRHADGLGYDLGPFQRSLTNEASQQEIHDAYDTLAEAKIVGRTLRVQHDAFSSPLPVASWYVTNVAGGSPQRMAWQLAVLDHNWPAAAWNICRKGYATYDDDAPRDWIINATGGRLATPREWVVSYIERSTVFVNWLV